jgi:hypothetical protein
MDTDVSGKSPCLYRHSSTLKMNKLVFFENLVHFYETTLRQIQEYRNIDTHRLQNFKFPFLEYSK